MISSNRLQPDLTAEFVRLYAAHNRRIYGFLRALIPNPADVDEAFQNTCAALWSKFHQFNPETDFFAWSCSVARFEALRLLRTRGQESRMFSDKFFEAIADRAMEMSDVLDRQHLALSECFESLSLRQKRMIQLRYAVDGSTKQVADQFSMTTNAVYKTLRKTHEMLFRCIQRKLAGDER
jgi:RNA polymerase sigma-70 factor, ECF subfamily